MIYLPKTPTSTSVASFWIVMAILVAIVAGVVYLTILPSSGLLVGAVLLVCGLLTLAVWRPGFASAGYLFYVKGQRGVVIPLVRIYLSAIVFYGLMVGNRLTKSRLDLAGMEEIGSMWRPKVVGAVAGGGTRESLSESVDEESWGRNFYQWIKETGNWWMVGLIPFMAMIHALDFDRKNTSAPSETYTLY